MKIPLKHQIEEVGREIGLRKNVYPKLIESGRLTKAQADMHLARLEAAHRTLKWLEANREAVVNGALDLPTPNGEDAGTAGFTMADLEIEGEVEQFIRETLLHVAEPGTPGD